MVNRTIVSLTDQEKDAIVESLPTDPAYIKSYVRICFADVLSQKDQHERK